MCCVSALARCSDLFPDAYINCVPRLELPGIELPLKAMRLIAQHLGSDSAALGNLSLVSRFWHACVSTFVFQEVTITIGDSTVKQVDDSCNEDIPLEHDLTEDATVFLGCPWLEPNVVDEEESDADDDDFDPDYVPSARAPQSLHQFLWYIYETPIADNILDLTIRAHKTTRWEETGTEVVEMQPWITATEFVQLLGCLPKLRHLHLIDTVIDPDYNANRVMCRYGSGELDTLLIEYTGAIELTVSELVVPLTLLCMAGEVELRGFRCQDGWEAATNPVICDMETLRLVGTNVSPALLALTSAAQNNLRLIKTIHLGRLVPSDIPTLRDVMALPDLSAGFESLTLDFDFAHYTQEQYTIFEAYMRDLLVYSIPRHVNFNIHWDPNNRIATWETCWPVLGRWLKHTAESAAGPPHIRYLGFKFGNFTDGCNLDDDTWAFGEHCDGSFLRLLEAPILQLAALRSVQFLDWGREPRSMSQFRQVFFAQWLNELSNAGLISFHASGLPESQRYVQILQKINLGSRTPATAPREMAPSCNSSF